MNLQIVPFERTFVPALAELRSEDNPAHGERWRSRFHWQYEANPEVKNLASIGWTVISDEGSVQGSQLFMPQRFCLFGVDTIVPISTDTFLARDIRGMGMGKILFKTFFDKNGGALQIGTSGSPVTCHIWSKAGGGTVPSTENAYAAYLRLNRIVQAKLQKRFGRSLSRIAGYVADCLRTIRKKRCERFSAITDLQPQRVGSDHSAFDEIWADCRDEYAMTAVRDSRYIAWRHGLGGSCLVLLSDFKKKPIAWSAYVETAEEGLFPLRRARILDLFGSVGNLSHCVNVIRALLSHLYQEGFDAADFRGLHPQWQTALAKAGCRHYKVRSTFCYYSKNIDRNLLENAMNWHLVPADGDCGFWDLPMEHWRERNALNGDLNT